MRYPRPVLLRQLFDARSSTYTYLLADEATREGVLIDTVFEQHTRDAALVRELGIKVLFTLETHVHADHVTGAWLCRQELGSKIAVSKRAGVSGADVLLDHGDEVRFGAHVLHVRATPGHTDGCTSFVLDDGVMVFTGDALLIRGAGRTDFQQGDAAELYGSITRELFALPDTCLVYPGHDYSGRTVTTVGEEKAWNPRVGGAANERDFVGYMENLGLPHPKLMDIAVPANLRCGEPEVTELPSRPTWGPVTISYAGIPEIDPAWVAEHIDEVTLLDVREPDEVSGPDGRIGGAVHVPLGALRDRAGEVPKGRPVVTLCRSGRRSAQATAILRAAGVTDCANLVGGMLRWNVLGLPTG